MFILVAAVIALASAGAFCARAQAAPPGAGWEISSIAQPTNFSIADNARCAKSVFCDHYTVTLTNVGSAQTAGQVLIADTLPAGLTAVGMSAQNLETGGAWTCSRPHTTCTSGESVRPGATLAVRLEVEVSAPNAHAVNAVTVSGGGAQSVSTSEPLTLPNTVAGPPAPFGISAFGFEAHDAGGQLDTQADDRASGVTSTVNFNSAVAARAGGAPVPASVAPPKNLAVYLPLGFLGDPTAASQCTERQLSHNNETNCPPASRVGTIVLFEEDIVTGTIVPRNEGGATSAVYNMAPENGYPAQLGFSLAGVPVPLYVIVVHTPLGYALRVGTPGIPTTLNIEGAALTLFGDPNKENNNPSASQAFLTNPSNCEAGPLMARVQADSWPNPGHWITAEAVAYPKITGCNLLQFEPAVEMHPEVTEAEQPTGYEIKIKVPQNPEQFPVLAVPQLKNVTMTLPEGMAIAAGGGVGLTGCEATGPNGIDMPTNLPDGEPRTPTEVGEGEAIGQDGMSHLTPGHCPPSSQIGTVKITTPVLTEPLKGHLYVAQPQCGGPGQLPCTPADATNGRLFGLYLEAEGSGVVVKLRGSASVDPATGRLTARFTENPQLPVSEVAIDIAGGDRSPLSNPRTCGMALVNGDFTPWSSPMTPDAIVSGGFAVDWDGSGIPGNCPATLPFAPGFTAGVSNVTAGGFSPFLTSITRGDRQQDLARLQVTAPPGLLGMLSKVPLCEEPQAREGTCGEASQVGTTSVAVGPGSQPLVVGGRVYLTGPYAGAPFGFSIVVPAVAGPFNLGNVVVRARINADPHTAAITVTSDPLPQILDGVPLRIQTVNVSVDRPGFIFNPTSCTAKHVSATIEAEQGASSNRTVPFAVEGCKTLPFKPSFKVFTQARASKKNGASLDVKITSAAGQANIGKVVASLPKQLPSRLTTLQQACPAATFAANPATCPIGSDVGTVKVLTPVLSMPATGPAYLVSHGGAAFPDLVIILQAQGVRLDLVGNTSIKKGITTSTFASAPDAPITSFELKLPQGPHSVLTANLPAGANGSVCGQKLTMPTTLTGQNNALIKQNTKITITGCPKAQKAKKARARARAPRSRA
jgi:hypothetical protein